MVLFLNDGDKAYIWGDDTYNELLEIIRTKLGKDVANAMSDCVDDMIEDVKWRCCNECEFAPRQN